MFLRCIKLPLAASAVAQAQPSALANGHLARPALTYVDLDGAWINFGAS
jgi:hypothetical protein